MNVNLMFRDRDFKLGVVTLFGKEILSADLELPRIIDTMAGRDDVIKKACETALFTPLTDMAELQYRQAIIADARRNPEAIRALYGIVVDTLSHQTHEFRAFASDAMGKSAAVSMYRSALAFLNSFIGSLMALRQVADKNLNGFESEGMRNLLTMFQREMDDKYFKQVRVSLTELDDAEGETLISAKLGHYLQGVDYVMRKLERGDKRSWRLTSGYEIPEKQIHLLDDLRNRTNRAINGVSNTLSQAAKNLQGFFTSLREELAFYIGCLNIEDALRELGMPMCVPKMNPMDSKKREWRDQYDVSLALTRRTKVVPGVFSDPGAKLYLITGANQGGKTTFLRGIGQAQLMAQCGMVVGAESCEMPLRRGLFTHFRREEDSRMKSGKLDEELTRLARALDFVGPGTTVMFNESFASTNEREGSEILRQITDAFVENGVEVFSVTHLFAYADVYKDDPETRFLRAERLPSGERTFKIVPGEPLRTAFGEDLYNKIFAEKA
ncbi:MAG: hypothetical protein LBN02_09000 [Oscillospiraceae bacterium]|jgi:hypothetical protein|nr:hypothetical protein [Oscillospiraceae bacterium]